MSDDNEDKKENNKNDIIKKKDNIFKPDYRNIKKNRQKQIIKNDEDYKSNKSKKFSILFKNENYSKKFKK